ncbi:WD40 repeat domain-containing protein [cf. Phormidesmis sp. LEGE 11477]|uniref:NACHT and WD repeat domain-containing protein n=1 Tax=cf. Phormidesmis sp. LEGE 11477 TaxID=1828680 RepID=UPI00187FFA3B|nr:WD40 repeat domain-containing protein [cf. Phormidesmis sp. LEGE 11477]MBE9059953.1 AAA family ATPase [cf. Phormidesmis sp. LEGE 11477]
MASPPNQSSGNSDEQQADQPLDDQQLNNQQQDNQQLDSAEFNGVDSAILEHNQTALNNLRRAVVLGQGQFSLILARANYRRLRQVLLNRLEDDLFLNVVLLPPDATNLRESVAKEIGAIAAEQSRWQATTQAKALVIIGIEEIAASTSTERLSDQNSDLTKLLKAANLGRDELPKHFPYPVVLWANDTVLAQLNRYAPDLKSFAATPIRFDYPLSSLVQILSAQADDTFEQILESETVSLWPGRLPLSAQVSEPTAARELTFAIAQLTQIPPERDQLISLDLLADLLFLQGRSLHRRGDLTKARNHYEKALLHWQVEAAAGRYEAADSDEPIDQSKQPDRDKQAEQKATAKEQAIAKEKAIARDREAVLLFHLGVWWRGQRMLEADNRIQVAQSIVDRKSVDQKANYQQARRYFEGAVEIFEQQRRLDRVSRFILPLAEVVQKLEDWDGLMAIAQKAVSLHQDQPIKLAQDYGYWAKALLAQNNNHPTPEDIKVAQTVVLRALGISQTPDQTSDQTSGQTPNQTSGQTLLTTKDKTLLRYQRGGYFYLLARTYQLEGQIAAAIENLEQALQNTNPYYDFALYRQILDRLWMLYFRHKQYAQAFRIKLEQRRIESLLGLRAFIGAGQIQPVSAIAHSLSTGVTDTALSAAIQASGRDQDIKALVEKLAQPRYPIVVIHGQSGVGKSSILRAGLIPELHSLIREGRTTFPILISEYSDWENRIRKALSKRLSPGISKELDKERSDTKRTERSGTASSSPERSNVKHPAESPTGQSIVVGKLTDALTLFTQARYQQIVLIFDQFEDFFYEYSTVAERRELYTLLRDCLNLPYVKVVLSLREDFLHYLLEWDRNTDLEAINNDILSKEIRYYLGNFTPAAAETLIHRLSEPSAFSPEPALVSALVDDLAALTGEVRPIELQVVGAQLQRQKIETLSAYKSLGQSPKKQLLKSFLNNVIYDCGPENRTVANSVLYLLSEGEKRPLKSLSELREPLTLAGIKNTPQQLSLVLDIFIGSGLVFEVPEVSSVRYQLVHEYLASLVSDQQPAGLMEVLQVERDRRALTEDQLRRALAAQSETLAEATLARQQARLAEIEALISTSRSLRLSGNGIEALVKALKAASQAANQMPSQATSLLRMQAALCLSSAIYGIREKNILLGHRDWVLAVDCSAVAPYTIVSASEDGTLKLWTQRGELVRTLVGHEAGVIDVCFSPDGRYLVSAGMDRTIRLWRPQLDQTDDGQTDDGQADSELIQTIDSTPLSVTSVSFNPAASIIAATYSDTTTRLWNLNGELITTLVGHEDWARAVAFSPDGQLLATGSEDKTVRLWSLSGELLRTLRGHRGWVRSVSFSPDGTKLAAAGDSNNIRLWAVDGRRLKTFYGHEDCVRAIAFSPDGQRLASASDDQTIRVWTLDGQVLEIFKHRSSVHSVAWSGDGRSLVSGGDDDQVRIWQLTGPTMPMLESHNGIVWSARWQPNADQPRQILSVAGDGNLRLWAKDSDLVKTISLHQQGAHSVDWHPAGTQFAIACADYSIQIRQPDGTVLQSLHGHGDMVWQVRYSPDGKYLASVSSDQTLRLWNQQGQPLKILTEHTNTVWSVSFSPDGRYLLSAGEDSTLHLWHVETGLIQKIKGHTGGVWCVAFSPDGKFVATGGADGAILLWPVRQLSLDRIWLTPRPIRLQGHRDWVRSLRFSPDGTFLASGSDDSDVRLWPLLPKALQTPSVIGELLPPLTGHEGVVWDVDFDPSGKRLLSAGADGTVRIWNLSLADLQRQGYDWLSDWLLARPEIRQQLDEDMAVEETGVGDNAM